MPKKKSDYYTYRVTWSEDDQEFVGLCAEFPSLSWLATTPEGAIKGIQNVVSKVLLDLEKTEEVIPEPLSRKSFSGKFIVRVPSQLHRKLAIDAAESGVSLNRLVSSRLT